jgi:hypothetical protein
VTATPRRSRPDRGSGWRAATPEACVANVDTAARRGEEPAVTTLRAPRHRRRSPSAVAGQRLASRRLPLMAPLRRPPMPPLRPLAGARRTLASRPPDNPRFWSTRPKSPQFPARWSASRPTRRDVRGERQVRRAGTRGPAAVNVGNPTRDNDSGRRQCGLSATSRGILITVARGACLSALTPSLRCRVAGMSIVNARTCAA